MNPLHCVCVADLHGRLPEIPACDVLIIAGDLAPDHPQFFSDPGLSRIFQEEWLMTTFAKWETTVPAERIVMTPGNHDWFLKLPAGLRTELYIDTTVEVAGRRFFFTPWVPPIGGAWNFELTIKHRAAQFEHIPKGLDVLVSHAPAFGVGDRAWDDERAGCRCLRTEIFEKRPRHHVFGHIHEGQREGRHFRLGQTDCWHASMWANDWKPIRITL